MLIRGKNSGFTLVELMMALIIASIVLAAVVTLAGATMAANDATDQMGRQQAHLRQVSMRLSDLIRRANRVMTASSEGFELWHDDNADGLASADELTQVTRGADENTIMVGASETHSNCQNVSFRYDAAAPDTRFITIVFSLEENGVLHQHSVNARLWVSDEHRKF